MSIRYLDFSGAVNFWTNIKNYITAHTPTKTSDLTNDSNFVDTSNSAVASGITSAKVTSYDSHIADTDIHVTTADKNKWNNQAYVFRYSSTTLTPSSTNSNALLDNTDNLKVGDKVIDSSGVLFSVTAIDTQNSTFTIGTALIDLAQDSDVVHKSGNETVGGQKTFTNDIVVSKNASNMAIYLQNLSYDPKTNGQSGVEGKSCGINFLTSTGDPYININAYGLSDRTLLRLTNSYFTDSQNVDYDSVEFSIYGNGARSFRPKNTSNCDLGESNKQWKGVYATNYYYGANNVEFSTKFVTTDTPQKISSAKVFSATFYIYNDDSTGNTPNLYFKSSKAIKGDSSGSNNDSTRISHIDKNDKLLSYIQLRKVSNGSSDITFYCSTTDTSNQDISSSITFFKAVNGQGTFRSVVDNDVSLGNASYKWKDVNTYLVNGLTPSSLGMPSGNVSDFIDISSYFSNTGSGGTNTYTALANGWIYLRLGDISSCQVVLNDSSNRRLWGTNATGNVEQIIMPILKNTILTTTWVTNLTVNVATARFIPCQGNV